ncbi:uncharacterized protein PV09_00275 [Verruconis gallopava]|uniref:Uncharacterized protein n=1 Tax=Verruconis gallopava TaxID=253628 RepID=A0A0D2AS60_9PEZI|nr:uncharacterized protein PV09_00275 [Verruconis gallopava]KIW09380.1 hypothetical protein PV09_00275 [Verruconis gallopava]
MKRQNEMLLEGGVWRPWKRLDCFQARIFQCLQNTARAWSHFEVRFPEPCHEDAGRFRGGEVRLVMFALQHGSICRNNRPMAKYGKRQQQRRWRRRGRGDLWSDDSQHQRPLRRVSHSLSLRRWHGETAGGSRLAGRTTHDRSTRSAKLAWAGLGLQVNKEPEKKF